MSKYKEIKNAINRAFLEAVDQKSIDELYETHQLSISLDLPLEVQDDIRSETALAYINKIRELIFLDSSLSENNCSNKEKRSMIRGIMLQLVEDCKSLISNDDTRKKYMYN